MENMIFDIMYDKMYNSYDMDNDFDNDDVIEYYKGVASCNC